MNTKQNEWEAEISDYYLRRDLNGVLQAVRDLLTKQREEVYKAGKLENNIYFQEREQLKQEGRAAGYKEAEFENFEAGRFAERAAIAEKVKDKKFKVAKNFETESHAGYFYKGYNSAVAEVLSLLTPNTEKQ